MRIDVIEVKSKKNKIKIIIIVLIAILFIISSSIFGIYCAKKYKLKLISEKNTIKISKNKEDKTVNLKETAGLKEKVALEETVKIKSFQEKINNIYSKDSKVAYLTFDDGPSTAVTPLILDVLKEENVRATFFVLGSNVRQNPDIVKRAYQEGHYIANHGYSHKYSKIYKNEKTVLEEYNKTEKLIKEAIENTEYESYLFRFPGGYVGGKYEDIKKKAGEILNKNNISYVDWNVLTGDAEGANTKEKIIKNIKKHTKDKGNIVVLMHDSASKILTYETLKEIINYLRKEGYTFENFYYIMQ